MFVLSKGWGKEVVIGRSYCANSMRKMQEHLHINISADSEKEEFAAQQARRGLGFNVK